MILAMDVFEHLTDPVGVVESLWGGLKPVALLFARIHAEADSAFSIKSLTTSDLDFQDEELGLV